MSSLLQIDANNKKTGEDRRHYPGRPEQLPMQERQDPLRPLCQVFVVPTFFLQFSFSSLLIGWRTKQSQQNMKGSTKVCETPFMLSSILTICGMTSTLSQGISNWKTRTNNICLRKSTTRQHTGGFYPSNLAPLYSDCIPASLDLVMVVVEIAKLNDTLGQPGGLPSSTIESR